MKLTPRETEIRQLTRDGLTAAQIAAKLGIKRGTVENTRNRISRKLCGTYSRSTYRGDDTGAMGWSGI